MCIRDSGDPLYNPCIFSINSVGNWYDHHPGLLICVKGMSEDNGLPGVNYSPSINTWHHIAVVRHGYILTVYLDGQNVGSNNLNQVGQNYGNSYGSLSCSPGIGIRDQYDLQSAPYHWRFNGYISNFRVASKALYTSNFTLPTSDLTVSGSSAGGVTFITVSYTHLTLPTILRV